MGKRIWVAGLLCAMLTVMARGDEAPRERIIHFTPATKSEAMAADQDSRKAALEVAGALNLKLEALETTHFLIFTDWDEREYQFLKENVEGAYTAVCHQFNASALDTVFVGKLPIYMFANQKDFETFGEKFDKIKRNKLLLGYYAYSSEGMGHMAMWKPDVKAAGGDVHLAERFWAYVLTHEFTHAYVSRYRTNVFLPRWLNEGIADVVAYRQFPKANVYDFVHRMAANGYKLDTLFAHKEMTTFIPEDYLIAQTVVEAMLHDDPQTFLKFFNDLKEGMSSDEALQKEYHTDKKGLQRAWKTYALSLRG